MTLIQKIRNLIKKRYNLFSTISLKSTQIKNFNPITLISIIFIFSGLFFVSSNLIDKKNKENSDNLKEITENNEFSNLANFFISKINSPYEEVEYVIKNNDTVEKILKKYEIRD